MGGSTPKTSLKIGRERLLSSPGQTWLGAWLFTPHAVTTEHSLPTFCTRCQLKTSAVAAYTLGFASFLP